MSFLITIGFLKAKAQVSPPSPNIRSSDELILPATPTKDIPTLKVRAYPLQAVTSRSGQQTINILVTDRTLVPVEGAQVTLALRMPSGERRLYMVKDLTDSNGITKISFSFSTEMVGLVEIEVEALRSRLEGGTTTSFLIWW